MQIDKRQAESSLSGSDNKRIEPGLRKPDFNTAYNSGALETPYKPSEVWRGVAGPFWAKVAQNGRCWHWLGAVGRDGYGASRWNGSVKKAHRISWELAHGTPVPKGVILRHRCHNRICVRPAHLQLGTYADNRRDMLEAGRERATGRILSDTRREELHGAFREGRSILKLSAEFGVSRGSLHRQRRAHLSAGGAR